MAPRSPPLTNPDLLRRFVGDGLTTSEIAEQAGTTVRALRYALHRLGIQLATRSPVDLAPLLRDYAAGVPLDEIAAGYGKSTAWVRRQAQIARVRRPRRSVVAHRELGDIDSLNRLLAEHGSIRAAAAALGVGRRSLRDALVWQG